MFFHNYLKIMKKSSVHFGQKPWKKMCSWFWIYLLVYKEFVAAPRCISMFFKKRAAASERY